jgi:hypothetical protein
VRTISREVAETFSQTSSSTPQRLHAELLATSASGARAYLHGAAHDATVSQLHRTVRFGQSDLRWLEILQALIERLGVRSWIYREGKTRNLWILETSADLLAEADYLLMSECRRAYARGYFDSEDGCPQNPLARFYIQFVQKNYADIKRLRDVLIGEGITCGRIHNPSRRIDPDLWRFYIAARDHKAFALRVGSWHPRKRGLLEARFGLG